MDKGVFIQAGNVVCGLGFGSAAVAKALYTDDAPPLVHLPLADGRALAACAVDLPADALTRAGGAVETRNNRLAALTFNGLPHDAKALIAATPAERIGVVIGTSTAGISEGGAGLSVFQRNGKWPRGFELAMQELGDPAAFLADLIGASGPAYAISTACTSGAKALISATRMIKQGLCDVVLCGGVDTLCDMTMNGFGVLEALSPNRCQPFSANRSGIHIGEGAALFVVSAQPAAIRVAGWGESSDAHHISAPDPQARGARLAMQAALTASGLCARDIGYVNLHGTATRQNDVMEADAVSQVFGDAAPCSSTKPLTGHTLGAAGAIEAALLAMALEQGRAPRNRNDGAADPEIARINLLAEDADIAGRYGISCNYAFGGNNTALVLENCNG